MKEFEYFDVHSHLNLNPLLDLKEEVIREMAERSIETITVGTDEETSLKAVEIAKEHNLYATVGIHPTINKEFDFEKIKELAKDVRVVAIGECGLDYFRLENGDLETKNKQAELFKKHIELAIEVSKPLMIHARPSKGTMDAYEDVILILQNYKPATHDSRLKVNFHFFVGDLGIARNIVENGWTVSFDGPITFSQDYDEVIRFLPSGSFMAETDAPYAAPLPFRGQIAKPWMVKHIYEKLAEIRGEDSEILRKSINDTVKEFFGL